METHPVEVQEIVTACQALALRGCGSGIGGHVSIRVPGMDALWINAFDRTLGEITADDILMINFDGELLEGNRPISPGYEFHPGIYGQRSDVNAIVHTHGFWGSGAGLAGSTAEDPPQPCMPLPRGPGDES